MSQSTFHIRTSGNWSGGGKAVLNNFRHAAARHPQLSLTDGDIDLISRNYPNTGWNTPFVLMPQNAWPWHGPRLSTREHLKVTALRVASEIAMRRALGVIRLGSSIPAIGNSASPLLPNCLDSDFDTHVANIEFTPPPQDSPYIVSLGSINSYRGIEELVEGFQLYRRGGGNLPLRVVGGGSRHYISHIKKLTENVPDVIISNESVTRREALRLLHHASAAVLPSHVEASPFSLLEAQAVQRHVIASDIPGHRDILPPRTLEPKWFKHDNLQLLADEMAGLPAHSPGLPTTPLARELDREQMRNHWGDSLVQILARIA